MQTKTYTTLFVLGLVLVFALGLSVFAFDGIFGSLLMGLAIWELVLSIRSLPPQYWGVLLFFGRPIELYEKGPAIVPFGLTTMVLIPRTEIQYEFQSPPKIRDKYKVEDEKPYAIVPPIEYIATKGEVVVVRMNEPFQITFANRNIGIATLVKDAEKKSQIEKTKNVVILTAEERNDPKGYYEDLFMEEDKKKDPLNQRVTTDPKTIVRIHINDPIRFIQRVGSMEAAGRYIRSVVMQMLQTLAGHYTIAMALYFKTAFEEELRQKIEELIVDPDFIRRKRIELGEAGKTADEIQREIEELEKKSWGVNLLASHIESFGFPYQLNIALAGNVSAGVDKMKTITASEGEQQAEENRGIAAANNRERMLRADAKGLEAKAEVLKTSAGLHAAAIQAQTDISKNVKELNQFTSDLGRIGEAVGLGTKVAGNELEKIFAGSAKEKKPEEQVQPSSKKTDRRPKGGRNYKP